LYNIVPMQKQKQNFTDYYNQYKDKIFNYFWYRVNFNRALAEDLTADAFLKAFKGFKDFDHGRSFQSWMYAIAKNHLLNYYRTANRETDLLDIEKMGVNELKKIEDRLELEQAFDLINQLSEYHRDVLLLRYSDGLNNSEIAEILNKDEGAVRTQISRALEELRSHASRNNV